MRKCVRAIDRVEDLVIWQTGGIGIVTVATVALAANAGVCAAAVTSEQVQVQEITQGRVGTLRAGDDVMPGRKSVLDCQAAGNCKDKRGGIRIATFAGESITRRRITARARLARSNVEKVGSRRGCISSVGLAADSSVRRAAILPLGEHVSVINDRGHGKLLLALGPGQDVQVNERTSQRGRSVVRGNGTGMTDVSSAMYQARKTDLKRCDPTSPARPPNAVPLDASP